MKFLVASLAMLVSGNGVQECPVSVKLLINDYKLAPKISGYADCLVVDKYRLPTQTEWNWQQSRCAHLRADQLFTDDVRNPFDWIDHVVTNHYRCETTIEIGLSNNAEN